MPQSLQWCHEQLIMMHADAKVGHLGGNLSCLTALYHVFEQLHPNDRFILSKGHSAGALYTVLAAYDVIPASLLQTFHRDGTTLPGHPPANTYDAIPFATGSLGHGLSLAAGFALSQRMRGTNQRTFCLTSDGEWIHMGGVDFPVSSSTHQSHHINRRQWMARIRRYTDGGLDA
jgi:transketolase